MAAFVTAAAPTGMGFAQNTNPVGRASGTVADWPLTFTHHQFGVACFDTRTCRVIFNNFRFGPDQPTPSSASMTPQMLEIARLAGYGPVRLGAPPAKATWQSRDGTELSAEVDIAALFAGGLIRHKLPREDIAEGVSMGSTSIILEIDDRTINVYTYTFIPTRREQEPGNPYSSFREDLIKVDSRTY